MISAVRPSVLAAPSLAHPAGHNVYQFGMTGLALILLAVGVARVIRFGRWRMLAIVLASASAFWQETYGDWATYLRYSPTFASFGWPGPWTSPTKAWWFVAGYAVFYSTLYGLLIAMTKQVRGRRPGRNPYLATVALTLPVFYVFDLLFEGTTTALGYWTYGYTFGPSVHIGNGNFPLLWPIIEQVPFLMVAAVALAWRDTTGRDVFAAISERGPARLSQGARLIGVWIVSANLAFLLLTTLPLLAVRWIFGPDAPFPSAS